MGGSITHKFYLLHRANELKLRYIRKPHQLATMNMEFTQESAKIKPGYSMTSPLNANPDPKHFSYKVLGIFSWSVLIFCLVGLFAARRYLLDVARIVAIYMMIRLIALTFFYLVGLVKIRKAEKQAKARQTNRETGITPDLEVHHLVVIPNYMEPADILKLTLQSLALQPDARDRMTVVLGMEEREQDAVEKVRALMEQFNGRFYCMLATYHPSHLPGENPGKATNESWATHVAQQELVERRGIAKDRIVVTVVDFRFDRPPLLFWRVEAPVYRRFPAIFTDLAGTHSSG